MHLFANPGGDRLVFGRLEGVSNKVGNTAHLLRPKTTGRAGRRSKSNATCNHWLFGIVRYGIFIHRDVGSAKGSLGCLTRDVFRP